MFRRVAGILIFAPGAFMALPIIVIRRWLSDYGVAFIRTYYCMDSFRDCCIDSGLDNVREDQNGKWFKGYRPIEKPRVEQ